MEKIVGNEQEKIMRKVKESKYKQLDHLTFLLRNLYAGQEATVRTGMEQQTGSK